MILTKVHKLGVTAFEVDRLVVLDDGTCGLQTAGLCVCAELTTKTVKTHFDFTALSTLVDAHASVENPTINMSGGVKVEELS